MVLFLYFIAWMIYAKMRLDLLGSMPGDAEIITLAILIAGEVISIRCRQK